MLSHILSNLFHSFPVPEPTPVYQSLRANILGLSPAEIGLQPSPQYPNVWGILMETGFENAPVLLMALADGTTSLYFGTGGGILGGGQQPAVAQSSRAFLAEAEQHVWRLTMTAAYPLPGVGRVRFYALTFLGAFTADVAVIDLVAGHHPLSPLYSRGQDVITQLRLLSKSSPSSSRSGTGAEPGHKASVEGFPLAPWKTEQG